MSWRERIHVGTSGWVYPGWREHLYRGVPARRWLEVASRRFGALEVNGSFYGTIRRETYQRWREQAPERFPQRPVTLWVPWPAGGSTDILGTLLYRVFFGFQIQTGDPYMGAAIATVMFLIILCGVMLYLLSVQRRLQRYQF